jgi:hypothetical protein
VISSSAACLAITSGSLALYRAVSTPGRLERVIASGSGSWGNVLLTGELWSLSPICGPSAGRSSRLGRRCGREGGGPGQPGQHQCEQRQVGRGDHRPGCGQYSPDGCPARQATPCGCSPGIWAYSWASQHLSEVTATAITSAVVVGNVAPVVSRIAAVTIAPYMPMVWRRPRFFVVPHARR